MMMSMLEAFEAFCWPIMLTLFHVSWIGFVIGIIAFAVNRIATGAAPSTKYLVNFVAMCACVVSLPITFFVVRNIQTVGTASIESASPTEGLPSNNPQTDTGQTPNTFAANPQSVVNQQTQVRAGDSAEAGLAQSTSETAVTNSWRQNFESCAPYVAGIYVLGVLFMLLRLVVAIQFSRRLRRVTSAPPQNILDQAKHC